MAKRLQKIKMNKNKAKIKQVKRRVTDWLTDFESLTECIYLSFFFCGPTPHFRVPGPPHFEVSRSSTYLLNTNKLLPNRNQVKNPSKHNKIPVIIQNYMFRLILGHPQVYSLCLKHIEEGI